MLCTDQYRSVQARTRPALSSTDIVVILQHQNISNYSVIGTCLLVKVGKITIIFKNCLRQNCHTKNLFSRKYPICSHTNRYHGCHCTSPQTSPIDMMLSHDWRHAGLGQICPRWSSDDVLSDVICEVTMCQYMDIPVTNNR